MRAILIVQGIGGVEFMLVALAGGLAAALLFGAWRGLPSPRALLTRTDRAPLPLPWLIGGLVLLLISPGVGWMLAPALVSFVIEALPSGMLVLAAPADATLARVYAATVTGGTVAVPGAAMITWLLASSRRSPRAAAAFALATGLGFVVMAAATLGLASTALESMASTPVVFGQPLQLSLLESVRMAARAALGAGVMGAAGGALLVMAAASERGLQVATWASAALPLVATSVAALATPPDVMSQLLALPVLVAPWLAGLGAGWILRRARREPATGG